jgi:hypothetical protein
MERLLEELKQRSGQAGVDAALADPCFDWMGLQQSLGLGG